MVAASRLWRGIAGQLASMFYNRPASSLQDQEGVMVVMDVWRRASLGVVGWQQDLSTLQILLPLLLQSVSSLSISIYCRTRSLSRLKSILHRIMMTFYEQL